MGVGCGRAAAAPLAVTVAGAAALPPYPAMLCVSAFQGTEDGRQKTEGGG